MQNLLRNRSPKTISFGTLAGALCLKYGLPRVKPSARNGWADCSGTATARLRERRPRHRGTTHARPLCLPGRSASQALALLRPLGRPPRRRPGAVGLWPCLGLGVRQHQPPCPVSSRTGSGPPGDRAPSRGTPHQGRPDEPDPRPSAAALPAHRPHGHPGTQGRAWPATALPGDSFSDRPPEGGRRHGKAISDCGIRIGDWRGGRIHGACGRAATAGRPGAVAGAACGM